MHLFNSCRNASKRTASTQKKVRNSSDVFIKLQQQVEDLVYVTFFSSECKEFQLLFKLFFEYGFIHFKRVFEMMKEHNGDWSEMEEDSQCTAAIAQSDKKHSSFLDETNMESKEWEKRKAHCAATSQKLLNDSNVKQFQWICYKLDRLKWLQQLQPLVLNVAHRYIDQELLRCYAANPNQSLVRCHNAQMETDPAILSPNVCTAYDVFMKKGLLRQFQLWNTNVVLKWIHLVFVREELPLGHVYIYIYVHTCLLVIIRIALCVGTHKTQKEIEHASVQNKDYLNISCFGGVRKRRKLSHTNRKTSSSPTSSDSSFQSQPQRQHRHQSQPHSQSQPQSQPQSQSQSQSQSSSCSSSKQRSMAWLQTGCENWLHNPLIKTIRTSLESLLYEKFGRMRINELFDIIMQLARAANKGTALIQKTPVALGCTNQCNCGHVHINRQNTSNARSLWSGMYAISMFPFPLSFFFFWQIALFHVTCLQTLFKKKTLQIVGEPIALYLRGRDDAIRCVVNNLFQDEINENQEVVRKGLLREYQEKKVSHQCESAAGRRGNVHGDGQADNSNPTQDVLDTANSDDVEDNEDDLIDIKELASRGVANSLHIQTNREECSKGRG
ncbi:hypothetical protein RFI_03705 [Reticulomyxa filosa]|uniref:Uncharacterized protein n=1 Tax=Reticulomyxa filosa TaxID=46433 RepID=X6P705_RETFI|nr:hypothetical protein RFI_03705 [Reticulomyxa filosa]|eukprot:ETO33402.1 hypothetical protein RFI_03705 [Reticulomyxa filosa]